MNLIVLIMATTDGGHRDKGSSAFVRGMLGGAAYGLTAAAISHPFDTVKTRLQTRSVAASPTLLHRVLHLYKGVGPATAASILFRTVPFVGYEWTRSLLQTRHLLETQPLLAAFLGGVVGGVMRGCLETPAEFVKTRLQVGTSWHLPLLLQGLSSTMLRNACMIGLFWSTFEATADARARLPPMLSSFVGGGACSVIAWAAAYPLDTAKSVIQASPAGATPTVPQALARIMREQGVLGWYAGLSAGLMRALIANGAGMAAYGWVQAKLAPASM